MSSNNGIFLDKEKYDFYKYNYEYLLHQNLILKKKLINSTEDNIKIKKDFGVVSEKCINQKKIIANKDEKINDLNDALNKRHEDYYNVRYLLPKDLGRKWIYKKMTNKELNLSNPRDLNEKINWLIVYKHGIKEGKLTDKHLVKEIIANMHIKDLHIPKTYKIYKNANDIKLDELPDKFVLKCNHMSGTIFICKDKHTFDFNMAKETLNNQLKRKYSLLTLEYHYDFIDPCIIAEEYLDDKEHPLPLDYKFFTMNGKVENILLCSNRGNELKLDDYDCEWNKRNYSFKEFQSNISFKKPKNLERMIEIAEELGKEHIFVRVDLYEINNKIYFGELTFTPANGYLEQYKQETLDLLGDKLILP